MPQAGTAMVVWDAVPTQLRSLMGCGGRGVVGMCMQSIFISRLLVRYWAKSGNP